MDPLSIAQNIYSIAAVIYSQVQQVKANQEQCQLLANRIGAIEGAIKKLGALPRSEAFGKSLIRLEDTLIEIRDYMKKLSEERWFRQFVLARRHDNAFKGFNDTLTVLIPELSLGLDAQTLMNQASDQKALHADQQALLAKQEEIIRLNEAMLDKLNQVGDKEFHQRQHQSMRLRIDQLFQMLQEQKSPLSPSSPILSSPPTSPKKEEAVLDAKLVIPYYALELKALLGQGTFSKIYRGVWQGTPVAIKVWEGTLSAPEKQQFIRETQVLQRLRTPVHVPQLYGACLEGNQACLVMEYCPLGSLDQYLKTHPLSAQQQRALALSIAKALKFLHDNQVVHRYFKSANILLVDAGQGGLQAKITGFGLSKTQYPSIVSAQLKLEGLMTGLAPEVLEGKEATMAADTFSFGSVLWELLTGRRAFSAITPQQFKQGCQEDCRQLPEGYALLIKACWDLDPVKRPGFEEIIAQLMKLPEPTVEVLGAAGVSDMRPATAPTPSLTLSVESFPQQEPEVAPGSPAQSHRAPSGEAKPTAQSAARSPSVSVQTPSIYDLAKKYHAEKKYDKAREYYAKVLQGGTDPDTLTKARTKLATLLIRGNGGKPAELKADQARAVRLFEQSAAEKDTLAMQNLEQAYRHGIGAEKSEPKADEWRARHQALNPKAAFPGKSGDPVFHSMHPGQASAVNFFGGNKPPAAGAQAGKPFSK